VRPLPVGRVQPGNGLVVLDVCASGVTQDVVLDRARQLGRSALIGVQVDRLPAVDVLRRVLQPGGDGVQDGLKMNG